MKSRLQLENQQRAQRVNRKYLLDIIRSVLEDELRRHHYVLAIYLVGTKAMTPINETHLRHAGPTDVISFDYSEPDSPGLLVGDIFVCVDEAVRQASKFHTTWQSELVRYVLHGILHLCGYDDQQAQARKRMKTEENRIMRRLISRFDLSLICGRAAGARQDPSFSSFASARKRNP